MKRWAMALFVFAGSLLIGSAVLAQPATGSFGFNGSVSGFATGAVRITGAVLTISPVALSTRAEGFAAWRTCCRDR
jgi:hypothetical protein